MEVTRFCILPLSLIVLAFCVGLVSGHVQCKQDQQSVLLNWKGNLTFPKFRNSTLMTWNSSLDCCDWAGVTCDDVGNVYRLRLSGSSIRGPVPAELSQLTKLVYLDLSYNQFSGAIPASIFEISSLLVIDLAYNQFEGQIPRSLFTRQLNVLDLSRNQLNGSIHLDWFRKFAKLPHLDLSYNNLNLEVSSSVSNISSFPQFTYLNLASCNLTRFPDLGNQPFLEYLDLSNNNITEVHPWFEMFASGSLLYLNLSCNLLNSLPELTKFHSLGILDVHGNHIHDKIPSPPPTVNYVDYSSNYFNSLIPESICDASNLKVLDLSNNHLYGNIPTCLIRGNSNLGVLNLQGNHLSGIIPNNFQVDCGLQALYLNNNRLQGKLPATLANCTKLEVLDLGNNQIIDNFPCSLEETLSNLRVLILRNNHFHGQIGCPTTQSNWSSLQIIELAENQLNGILPERLLHTWKAMMDGGDGAHDGVKFDGYAGYMKLPINRAFFPFSFSYQDAITIIGKGIQLELAKIMTYHTSIDFSYNQFEGPLPEVLGQFKALYNLNLSHNSFSGPILPSIGNLSQLESLDLSANSFSGAIPHQLAELSFLEFLNVSDNKLSGEIPKGTQIQSFSQYSFQDNVGLCGLPLPQPCHHHDEPTTPSSARDENGEDWQLMVAAGMGFVVGVAAAIAPMIYDKTYNRWVDYLANRIYEMLVSCF